jgi:DNA repair ATPase RecN
MALVESVLSNAIERIYNQMDAAASETPKTNKWLAEQLAKAVTDQIKTAEIAAGEVIVSVSGNAAGTPNPSPIMVV